MGCKARRQRVDATRPGGGAAPAARGDLRSPLNANTLGFIDLIRFLRSEDESGPSV